MSGARFANQEAQVVIERGVSSLISAHGAGDSQHFKSNRRKRPPEQAILFITPAAAATLDYLLERVLHVDGE